MVLLTANNLYCSYGTKSVLHDISFSISSGTITGLLGPSGAGKTTLVNLLTGQLKPDKGMITLTVPCPATGVMMDDLGLYERLTVWDNLALFAELYRVSKKRIEPLLMRTGLIQFVMFPLLAVIMTNAISLEDMPDNFFVTLFASMYVGMAPLTSISAIISEEKEKHTLRVLLMAGVSPVQYLLGTGCYVFLACMPGSILFSCLLTGVTFVSRLFFLLILSTGILVSIVVGATISIQCKNQMTATSVTVPVMMVFSFLPMLAMFNDTIAKIARFTYTEQIRLLIGEIQTPDGHIPDIRILLLNIVVFETIFSFFYRKQGKIQI